MTPFRFRGFGLPEAIDALMAYDGGATDSGVRDEEMRAAALDHLRRLPDAARRRTLAEFAAGILGRLGCGAEDVESFGDWLRENGLDADADRLLEDHRVNPRLK